jgi:hypothetical protein
MYGAIQECQKSGHVYLKNSIFFYLTIALSAAGSADIDIDSVQCAGNIKKST